MAATTTRRGASRTGPILRSLSPSGRLNTSYPRSSAASSFAYSSSSFISRTNSATASSFFNRSSSPTRVNLYCPSPPASSVRFSLDRPISPNRSMSVSQRSSQVVRSNGSQKTQRRTCMCSPTTHPGSFRCSLHKNCGPPNPSSVSYSPNRLNARRSAMTNSLVRIGGVEGDLVKRALSALIRPSSHQQRRRAAFHPRPSRLCIMSKAEDL